jgi:hypothetical protein
VRGWKKNFMQTETKRAGILLSDKIKFNSRTVKRKKDGH